MHMPPFSPLHSTRLQSSPVPRRKSNSSALTLHCHIKINRTHVRLPIGGLGMAKGSPNSWSCQKGPDGDISASGCCFLLAHSLSGRLPGHSTSYGPQRIRPALTISIIFYLSYAELAKNKRTHADKQNERHTICSKSLCHN